MREQSMKQIKEWVQVAIVTMLFTGMISVFLEMWFRQQGL